MDRTINVAGEFSLRPFGRTADHDPDANGLLFRESLLEPALRSSNHVTVDFAGTHAVAPSFLEEAFGGLIEMGHSLNELERTLTIRFPNDPSQERKTWCLIRKAAAKITQVA